MTAARPIVRRRIQAPQADGAALIDPPLAVAGDLVQNNARQLTQRQGQIVGRPWHQLACEARAELLAAARAYTGRYRDVGWAATFDERSTFILSGHQPQLFHPGVWLKNFLLSSLAERTDAAPINLIVDNDVIHSAAIRVPLQNLGEVEVPAVSFDAPSEATAWEERAIVDPQLFDSFGERAGSVLELPDTIVRALWPLAIAARQRQGDAARLGATLAEARHRYEHSLGLRTLELPLSALCRTRSFRRFAWHLLGELGRLSQIYNDSLSEYRRANRIRSRSHPVPDLAQRDEWLEAPLWIWTIARPRRQRLFVRREADRWLLSDLAGIDAELPSREDDGEAAIEALASLEEQGIKLRPRALVTTMFARLLSGDLFIHGIGGAKYDELTDAIIERFFDCRPPAYLTATATFRLPITRPEVDDGDLRALDRRLRDLRYHPESFLTGVPAQSADELSRLAEQKRALLAAHELRGGRRETFERFDAINRRMHQLLTPLEEEVRIRRASLAGDLHRARLLGSREFSFVLFPQRTLPQRLLDLCAAGS